MIKNTSDETDKKINKAIRWLMEITDELESIFNSSLGAKYKIILLMTYIDIVSTVWNLYNDNAYSKQKDVFIAWINKFMFSDSNQTYEFITDTIGDIDSELFYKIRNSLVHFSSVPHCNNIGIFITSDSKSEFCNRYPNETKGKKIIVLSPRKLFSLFARAASNTMFEMEKPEYKCRATMLKIAEKLNKESAFMINPKPNSKNYKKNV